MADTRISYGATCLWWDNVQKAGSTSTHPLHQAHNRQVARETPRLKGTLDRGLPCCPHCGGMLFEVQTEEEWFRGVDKFERAGHPGYRAFVTWQRGKCFATMEAAAAAYRAEGGKYEHAPEAQ